VELSRGLAVHTSNCSHLSQTPPRTHNRLQSPPRTHNRLQSPPRTHIKKIETKTHRWLQTTPQIKKETEEEEE
jgi:hypothetical protein